MHRLYLLRHAAAGWAGPGMRDFDRPLTEKGRADAAAVGRQMREHGYLPDLVLLSSAERTRETWSCVAPALGANDGGIREIVSETLYNGDADAYLASIREAPPAGSILLVGHNPMMAELASSLAGRGDKAALHAVASGFPKAGLAVFSSSEPLSHLERSSCMLEAFTRPARG